ncbi:MAG: cell division protein ZapE [Pseudohongiellaceae bacterium]
MTPTERYQADVARGKITTDPEQTRVIGLLSDLSRGLQDRVQPAKGAWLQRLIVAARTRTTSLEPLQGIYLWGGVGRGKTYLMDLFFASVEGSSKLRTHFHRFMQDVHRRLVDLQGTTDPLETIADELAERATLICFDEFYVSDIGDAMLLGGLLKALLDRDVVLVATSNVPPHELYENGLQREKFLPAIVAIEHHCQVVKVDSARDYRLERLSATELYLFPQNPAVDEQLRASFFELASDTAAIRESGMLSLLGRELETILVAEGQVWFSFDELCGGPRSAFDYVELAKLYRTVFLSGVPVLGEEANDCARRFISLVDELYDRRVQLIMAAEVDVHQLYTGQSLAFEFERTQSRLMEMRSREYLGREHLL